MSDRQIRDEVTTIYLAGHETTAVTLAWAWYLLPTNPQVARRVREEVHRVLGEKTPSIENLPNLTCTRMGIRRDPAALPSGVGDLAHRGRGRRDRGYRILAGHTFCLSPYVTHRRTDLWPNPEGFDPERFAPENGNGRPRFAYYQFGGGPPLCIGNIFALMEATLIVALVVQRYRLDLVPGQTIKAHPKGTVRPRSGAWMSPHSTN